MSTAGLLIGADVGGTTTRLAVADATGRVLAVAEQPAGNPNAVGVPTAARRIRTAIEQLPITGPVAAVVLGLAGYGTALEAGEAFVTAAVPAELGVRPRIVPDLAVAFASASAAARGTVVIAGTGSGAAEIDSGEIVARRGAWGWLLGDEGAGFWLGREAVRAALSQVERGDPPTQLTRVVLQRLGIDPAEPLRGLLRVPYQDTPVRLADLAPVVTGLADQDPMAAAICARSAAELAALVLDLRPLPGRPIVVGGSVLQADGLIRSTFLATVDRELGSPVLDARSGLVGALWLAAGTGPDGQPDERRTDPAVHAALLATAP